MSLLKAIPISLGMNVMLYFAMHNFLKKYFTKRLIMGSFNVCFQRSLMKPVYFHLSAWSQFDTGMTC